MSAARWVYGTALHPEDRAEVLRAHVHRYTGDFRPAWATGFPAGQRPPVHFRDDAEWLAHTSFAVRKDGRLHRGYKFCRSSPTWPYNPELRR